MPIVCSRLGMARLNITLIVRGLSLRLPDDGPAHLTEWSDGPPLAQLSAGGWRVPPHTPFTQIHTPDPPKRDNATTLSRELSTYTCSDPSAARGWWVGSKVVMLVVARGCLLVAGCWLLVAVTQKGAGWFPPPLSPL